MKRVAILVAAVAFTLSINIKVFATGVENLNNTQVNQTTVGAETTQGNTTNETGQVTNSTSTDTNINEVANNDTGIMPDSIFYFLDKAFDNIRLFLTFDDEKKIEILSQIADERLAESESMTQKEKYDLAKSTIEEFNNLITKASDKLNKLVEDNNNVISNEDKEMENKEVDLEHGEIKLEDTEGDKLSDLQKDILSKNLKSIEVLKQLSDKLDGNAKKAIEAVIEMQIAKKEALANMVEKRHDLNAARQEYQLGKINLEQAKKSGDEEAIKAAEEVLKEKQSLYKDAKEEFKLAFEKKKEVKDDLKKNAKKADKKKVENKQDEAKKVKDKNEDQDNKLIEQVNNKEVISTEEKVAKDENKNTLSSTEVKKVEEKTIKKAEEIRKENMQKLENKEIKNEDIKEKDKKIKEEIREKISENKEKDNDKKEKNKDN